VRQIADLRVRGVLALIAIVLGELLDGRGDGVVDGLIEDLVLLRREREALSPPTSPTATESADSDLAVCPMA